jgi:hypothetical protein
MIYSALLQTLLMGPSTLCCDCDRWEVWSNFDREKTVRSCIVTSTLQAHPMACIHVMDSHVRSWKALAFSLTPPWSLSKGWSTHCCELHVLPCLYHGPVMLYAEPLDLRDAPLGLHEADPDPLCHSSSGFRVPFMMPRAGHARVPLVLHLALHRGGVGNALLHSRGLWHEHRTR